MLMFISGLCSAFALLVFVNVFVLLRCFGKIKTKQKEIEIRQEKISKEIKQGSRMTEHRFIPPTDNVQSSNIVGFTKPKK